MFAKLNKLISVMLLLAMAFNGMAVLAEEIITINQGEPEEVFFEEEYIEEEIVEPTEVAIFGGGNFRV